MQDYKFIINLEEPDEKTVRDGDPRLELIKENLRALLDLVILTFKGEEIAIDGFRLIGENRVISLYDSAKEK